MKYRNLRAITLQEAIGKSSISILHERKKFANFMQYIFSVFW